MGDKSRLFRFVAVLFALLLVTSACGEEAGEPTPDAEAPGEDAPDEAGPEDEEEPAVGEAAGMVAFLLPENVTPRWEGPDRENFEATMAEIAPDVEVAVFNALNDPSQQQQQGEQAVTQGADVLVVAAVDQEAAGVIVEDAEATGVPVIAYDRLIRNAPLDYFITFDGEQVGRVQGEWLVDNTEDGDTIVVIHGSEADDNAHWFAEGYMAVLEPLFEGDERELGFEAWTPGWDPAAAQQQMEQALTQLDNDVQGVLSANDGMAATIIAALDAQGLAGQVPVTGQDATLQGVQLILQGQQGMSVFKDIRLQAEAAAEIAAAILAGQQPSDDMFDDTVDNGELEVPSVLLPVEVIEEANVQMLIDEGFYTQAEVCEGVPEGTGPC